MRKIVYFTIICLAAFAASLSLPTNASASVGDDQGDTIQCHCNRDITFHHHGCYVNNHGAICAQSQPGGNINCAEYSSNCSFQ
jgi:hypothetical protein